MVLPSADAASTAFAQLSYSRDRQLTDYRERPAGLGDEGKLYRGVLGPDSVDYETQIVTVWRRGNVVAMLNTIGASDISEIEHDRLVSIVDARMKALATSAVALPPATADTRS